MELIVIIKWVLVWFAVTFVLGGALHLYLKNAERAAKAAQSNQENKETGKADEIAGPESKEPESEAEDNEKS